MTIPDWFPAALLLILSALTIGIFIHIAISIGLLRRANTQTPKPNDLPSKSPRIEFQSHSETLQTILQPRDVLPFGGRLTKRELQVARLAARGLTDTEIANKLTISERTVGNHLYSIYRKLNINSRRELKYILQEIEGDS